MQESGSFSVIIPLDRATDRRICGAKTVAIARLNNLGFVVPDGFCLSTDAYRTHLWGSRVRTLARCCPNSEERAELRKWILESDLPADVITSLEQAYRALGRNATVVVRHSASDEEIAGKAYASVVGARGFRQIVDAVKTVWASLWSEEAAELRERNPDRTEPTMSLLVQLAVEEGVSGVSIASDPSTGDVNQVHIRSMWGIFSENAPADRASVNLTDFSIVESSIARKETMLEITPEGLVPTATPEENLEAPSLTPEQTVALAEAAIWIDSALGQRQIVHWVHSGEQIIILDAWPVRYSRPHFPVSWLYRNEGLLTWKLLVSEPAPILIQSLSVFASKRVLSATSCLAKAYVRIQNGRPYRRIIHPWEAKGRLAEAWDVFAGARLYRKWMSAAQRIEISCRKDLNTEIEKLSEADSRSYLRRSVARVEVAAEWMESLSYPAARFPHLLREMLLKCGLPSTTFSRLLLGCDPAWYERDSAFQRLAAFVWQAGEDELVKDAPQSVANEVASQLGYAFCGSADPYDPTKWNGWVEETESVLKIAKALARGPRTDTYLAQKAANSESSAAFGEALSGIRSSQGSLAGRIAGLRFRRLLKRSREAISAERRACKTYAMALSALRLGVLEIGRRLEERQAISSAMDLFHLTPSELLQVHGKMTNHETASLRRTLAERKHKMWLQSRMMAPSWLPLGAGPKSEGESAAQNKVLAGNSIHGGEVIGTARVALSLEDAVLLRPGEILVAEELSPAWTPLLSIASGLIMQKGQLLSQGAIAARNYGLPCVSDVSGALSVLQTGQLIRVDGANGTVEVLKRRS